MDLSDILIGHDLCFSPTFRTRCLVYPSLLQSHRKETQHRVPFYFAVFYRSGSFRALQKSWRLVYAIYINPLQDKPRGLLNWLLFFVFSSLHVLYNFEIYNPFRQCSIKHHFRGTVFGCVSEIFFSRFSKWPRTFKSAGLRWVFLAFKPFLVAPAPGISAPNPRSWQTHVYLALTSFTGVVENQNNVSQGPPESRGFLSDTKLPPVP